MAITIGFERGNSLGHKSPLPLGEGQGEGHHIAVASRASRSTRSGRLSKVLWTTQGLLAVLFLCTGLMKLLLPLEVLQTPFPGAFVRFLGLAEFLGAFGLILPSLLRIRPVLTPIAASGLVIIMIGATVSTLVVGGGATAVLPPLVGCLAAFVAYGRGRLAPLSRRSTIQS
ncbi:MAG TPA: DoxX family protein [Chloroflexota bacterium]|nr:DoxX family protein [Chloroflexota bacterium]